MNNYKPTTYLNSGKLNIMSVSQFIHYKHYDDNEKKVGQDSSVGIATSYGLAGLGIESSWWFDFPHLPRVAVGPPQLLV